MKSSLAFPQFPKPYSDPLLDDRVKADLEQSSMEFILRLDLNTDFTHNAVAPIWREPQLSCDFSIVSASRTSEAFNLTTPPRAMVSAEATMMCRAAGSSI